MQMILIFDRFHFQVMMPLLLATAKHVRVVPVLAVEPVSRSPNNPSEIHGRSAVQTSAVDGWESWR